MNFYFYETKIDPCNGPMVLEFPPYFHSYLHWNAHLSNSKSDQTIRGLWVSTHPRKHHRSFKKEI